jgi:hypothetical protein
LILDVGTISAALSSLQTATELAKGLLGARDRGVIEAAVTELREAIVSAQSSAVKANGEQMALQQRVREMQARLAEFEDWDREKKRYRLTDIGGGTFVCVLRPEMADGEPPHRICAQCYQKRQKGILQSHGMFSGGREKVSCQACDKETMLGRNDGSRQSFSADDGGWR